MNNGSLLLPLSFSGYSCKSVLASHVLTTNLSGLGAEELVPCPHLSSLSMPLVHHAVAAIVALHDNQACLMHRYTATRIFQIPPAVEGDEALGTVLPPPPPPPPR